MNKTKITLTHKLVRYLANRGFFNWMPDKWFLKMLYRVHMNKSLNLKNPVTFNEKIQWLKLYDRNPNYTNLVDKFEVIKYVSNVVGIEYIIPSFGVWDKFDDIDFSKLPNQFVLKCTHDSGGVIICQDKTKFDFKLARKKINKSLKKNYYYLGREWPYKNIHPRIIAEKLMVDESGYELKDYKFFCFDGVPKTLFVASDRFNELEDTKFDFFNMDFEHLPFTNGHENSKKAIIRPSSFEKMKKIASLLSKGLPHVRVDLYDINGKIYFGELTLSHFSGMVPFVPDEWDKIFGDWLILPQK